MKRTIAFFVINFITKNPQDGKLGYKEDYTQCKKERLKMLQNSSVGGYFWNVNILKRPLIFS